MGSTASTGRLVVSAETTYPLSVASPRVRLAGYVDRLAAEDIDLRYRPTLTDAEYAVIASDAGAPRKARVLVRAAARAARSAGSRDALRLVHRLRFLAPLPLLEPARHLDAYDFDDAIYLSSTLPSNRAFSWLKREGSRSIEYMRRARLVIAGNQYLADAARRWSGRVEIVPSCTDPSGYPLRQHGEAEVLTVGWIGSRSTTDYLETVLPAFERLNDRGTRTRLLLIGADRRLDAPWIEHRPWSLDAEAQALREMDVGIMPLPDDEWARGKCGYKLLQYFSAGIPAVASPVGVAASMVGEEHGMLANTADEWADALAALARDAGARAEIGARARDFVEREYSYERWAPELARMLRELAAV
jgi:glycosyltransferase involved in cell wall biosynthesis